MTSTQSNAAWLRRVRSRESLWTTADLDLLGTPVRTCPACSLRFAGAAGGSGDLRCLAAGPTGHAAPVGNVWRLLDTCDPLDADGAESLVRARLHRGEYETWFESDSGELMAVVTNGDRAMVMLLREPGDAGEHAVDASADASTSGGYVLANGQVDAYANRDTVPLATAMSLLSAVIDGRERSPKQWQIDR
jgi:hypothetical protein